MPNPDKIASEFVYQANGKFYSVRVTIDPRELARDAIRKGLLQSKTKRAQRSRGAVAIRAVEVTEGEAVSLAHRA
jgi:hypothetical protein